jgi:NAD(P)-dependent dehydrogenase (short-subunit alcohol dehydrogenase family)
MTTKHSHTDGGSTVGILEGRVALVTGGSRGLGKAMVEAFACRGADVVIASRKLANCVTLAAEVEERFGRVALPVGADVADWDDCDRLVDAAYAKFGRVDVLVNNAGMSPLYPSLVEVGEGLWYKVFGVNVKGPFRLTALIGTRMAAGEGGSIINISSLAATRPTADLLPYAAAKAGLNTLTTGFAHALGPKVRVNTIQCGAFRTDIANSWTPEFSAALSAQSALARTGEPDEIVGAAVYFATDASSFTTGATLCVDGGAS